MSERTTPTAPEDVLGVVRDYVPLLQKLSDGPCAVVCGPVHDSRSDLDFGVVVSGADPFSSDKEYVWAAIGERTRHWTSRGYVIDGPGVDRVEKVERDIGDCLAGLLRTSERSYRIRGHHSYIGVGAILRWAIVEDPSQLVAGWCERLRVYPPALKETIITTFKASLERWPNDPHYLRAIERGDLVLTTGVVQRVLHDWFHVMFALSETWHPGDKHILGSLELLPELPERCMQKTEFLLWPPKTDTALAMQRDILNEFALFALCRADNRSGTSQPTTASSRRGRPRG